MSDKSAASNYYRMFANRIDLQAWFLFSCLSMEMVDLLCAKWCASFLGSPRQTLIYQDANDGGLYAYIGGLEGRWRKPIDEGGCIYVKLCVRYKICK